MVVDYNKMAAEIIEKVGGRDNIIQAEHCFTRLRILLLDPSKVNKDEVNAIEGTKGCVFVGNQIQIVIGAGINDAYNALCEVGNLQKKKAINENLDSTEKPKMTVKRFFNEIMTGISGCIMPIVAGLICAGMISLIPNLLGPGMLNLISADSDLYRILTIAGNAPFYYFPVLVAYAASKKFNTNTVVAMILAFILVHPSMIEIVNSGQPFTVYGIPMRLVNYTSQFLPMVLITYALSYVDRWVKKIMPEMLQLVFVPVLDVLIMLPIALCALGPLASWIGVGLQFVFTWIYNVLGPVGMAIIGFVWPFILAGGMHHAILSVSTMALATGGADYIGMVCGSMMVFSLSGIAIGEMIRTKDPRTRAVDFSTMITGMVGGVTEPCLFGVALRNRRNTIGVCLSQAVSCFLCGLWHVGYHFWGSYNALIVLSFANPGRPMELVYGIIAALVGLGVGIAYILIVGTEDNPRVRSSKKAVQSAAA